MLEFIKSINNDYAGILSLFSSIIMIIITIIYVSHTRRQANYARDSVDLITKQMITDKQPCVVPIVNKSNGSAFDASKYVRIQLGFDIILKNVGDAPAINIYTLAEFECQYLKDEAGNKKRLSAALLPNFVQAISIGEQETIHIHFETHEVKELLSQLGKAMDMNWKRIETNARQHPYHGARLIIQVLYKNIMGQWNKSEISYEVLWLEYKKPLPQTTHDLNENTIPPREIKSGDEFRAVLVSSHLAPFVNEMISYDSVKAKLEQYLDESPWLFETIKKQ